MDLAQIAFIVDTEVAPSLGIPPLDPSKPLSAASGGKRIICPFGWELVPSLYSEAVRTINLLIEEQMKGQAAEADEVEYVTT